MEERSILLVGATGLVGGECLRLLLGDPAFGRVAVLTRRPLPDIDPVLRPRLEQYVVDFDRLPDASDAFRVDTIFCALGTTIKQAGSQERFRAVDYGYALRVAELGLEHGAQHYLLVSALGADARSRIFYNRVKGETEEAVSALPYRSVTVARPSLLLGARKESRLGEEVAKRFGVLIPGKYKPVQAHDVAKALVQAAKENKPGRWVLESDEIRRMGNGGWKLENGK